MPDINWVHYVHAAYRPVITASLVRRLKTLIAHPLNVRAERIALRSARLVVCNSNLTRNHVIELCGVEPSKAITIYYGSDPCQFFPPTLEDRRILRISLGWHPSRPVVIFIGALSDRRKGFDTLFEAWAGLCKMEKWDATLAVVGAGAEVTAWRMRAERAGMDDRIKFLGFRADVPDLLRASDVLVAPTRYEAYGLGVHEALCCGLPAIVSRRAGVAERYTTELTDLLLSDPENHEDLAFRLLAWYDNRADWSIKVERLSATLRAYTWDDMARDYVGRDCRGLQSC